jgi:hypothetical protein
MEYMSLTLVLTLSKLSVIKNFQLFAVTLRYETDAVYFQPGTRSGTG